MSRLSWDFRSYESGIDRGVLYLEDGTGVAWNGLTSVRETSDGYDTTSNYIDGYKYAVQQSKGGYAATLSAFTYPDEFDQYDGYADDIYTGQKRLPFNFSFRTKVGNSGYKIHLVYGALTRPSERSNQSMGSEMNPAAFSWDLVADAHYEINSTEAYPETLTAIEGILYGDENQESSLPPITDIIELFESGTTLRITDNGDGTWTASGPDEVVKWLDDTTFQIISDSIQILSLDGSVYRVQSE